MITLITRICSTKCACYLTLPAVGFEFGQLPMVEVCASVTANGDSAKRLVVRMVPEAARSVLVKK